MFKTCFSDGYSNFRARKKKSKKSVFRWLDLMAGCGIRSLRWGLEAVLTQSDRESFLKFLEIWVNDADFDRAKVIQHNLKPLISKKIPVFFKNDFADVFLARA